MAERELKLKMTIVPPDPSKPSQALQDIANQANRTSRALQDMNRQAERSKQALGGGGSGLAAPNLTGGGSAIHGGGYRPGSAINGYQNPWGQSNINFHTGAGPGPQRAPRYAADHESNRWNSRFGRAIFGTPEYDANGVYHGKVGGLFGGGGGGGEGQKGSGFSMGRVLGGTVAAATGIGAAIEGLAVLENQSLTTSKRITEAARAIPIFGDAIGSLASTVIKAASRLADWDGTAAAERARERHPIHMGRIQLDSAAKDQIQAIQRRTRDSFDTVAAREMFPGFVAETDRKTGLGGAIHRAAYGSSGVSPLRGNLEAIRIAERNLAASEMGEKSAIADVTVQAEQARRATEAAEDAKRLVERMAKEAGIGAKPGEGGFSLKKAVGDRSIGGLLFGGGGGAIMQGFGGVGGMEKAIQQSLNGSDQRYQDALKIKERAVTEQIQEQERLMKAEERAGQRSVDVLQKKLELEKQRTDLMKTRASMLEDEFAKSKQVERTFGAMDDMEQKRMVDAARRFKEGGKNAVAPGELEGLQRLDPEFFGKKIDEEVKKSPLLKQYNDVTGMARRDSETIGKELGKLKTEITMKAELDETQFAKLLREALQKEDGRLTGLINKLVDFRFKKLEDDVARGRAGSSG